MTALTIPEQLVADTLDGRSDVYSLGLVAFQRPSGRAGAATGDRGGAREDAQPDADTDRGRRGGGEGSVPVKSNADPVAVAPAPRVSYAGPLGALLESVTDSASARQAERALEGYRSTVRTRGDSAAMLLVAAKAALLTGGAERGCGIMRQIDAAALTGRTKQEFLEALPTCEGP